MISREPLTELMPLQKATNSDAAMTQYEMHGIEALGLLKFDFLGLSNLTILRAAVDLIREHRGVEIDLERIPLDDARTFELLASGETTGVFQLESAGMRRYIRELRPTSVYDLAAMVALYRPGPMDNIPAYIRRKHGQEKVTYLHPLLEPFLERTYGIFVYQEDIMAAATALGGFSGPEADTLGYAIRKKKSSVLRSMKDQFVTQAGERGVRPETIDAVFKAFEPFERYGFNKAHATTYGLVAYQTAYLKANYTVEYMASVLTAFRDNAEKVAAAVAECRRLGIAGPAAGRPRQPPRVHRRGRGDPLRAAGRQERRPGRDRVDHRRARGGRPVPLVRRLLQPDRPAPGEQAGPRVAGQGRGAQRPGAPGAAPPRARRRPRRRPGRPARARVGPDQLLRPRGASRPRSRRRCPAATEVPVRERLRWEKELLGLYLSDHPLGEVAERIGRFVTAYSGELKDESLDGQRVVRRRRRDRASARSSRRPRSTMAVVTLEDLQGSVEVVVFPRLYEQTGPTWQDGAILLVAGRIDHRGRGGLAPGGPGPRLRRGVGRRRGVVRGRGGGRRPGSPAGPRRAATATAGAANGHGRRARVARRRPGAGRRPAWSPPRRRSAAARRHGADGRGPRRRRGRLGPAAECVRRPPPGARARLAASRATWRRSRPTARSRRSPRRRARPRSGRPRRRRSRARPGPAGRLHVRFAPGIPADDLQATMASVRDVLRGRPGATRVTIHLPQGTGRPALPMELRVGRGLRRRAGRRGGPAAAARASWSWRSPRRRRAPRERLTGAARSRAPAAPRAAVARPVSCPGRPASPGRPRAGRGARRGRRRSRPARCPAPLAIWLRTALSGDEISSSAAATRKQARRTPRRCSVLDTRLNSRVTR